MVDEQGRLRLSERIPNFTLVHPPQMVYLRDSILYYGQWRQGTVHLHPDLGRSLSCRPKARELAHKWRSGEGE